MLLTPSAMGQVPSLYPATPQPRAHSLPFAFPRPEPKLQFVGCLWPTDSASFLSAFTSPLVSMGFDFNSYHLVASRLSLDMGYLFFGGFQHPPMDGCSAASCNFGVLAGADENTSFCSTILTNIDSLQSSNLRPPRPTAFSKACCLCGCRGAQCPGRQ